MHRIYTSRYAAFQACPFSGMSFSGMSFSGVSQSGLLFVLFFLAGLDSDESCEGTSEASFKDAVVDAGAEKNNGTVQENGIKKRR